MTNDLIPRPSAPVGTFDFRGHGHAAIQADNGDQWVSVTQMCQYIGLSSDAARRNIERSSWSQGWTTVLTVQLPGDRQARAHYLIHERRVPMWIANISTNHIRDDVVRRNVETYQREFADVLFDYVSKGRSVAARPAVDLPAWAVALHALVDQQATMEVEQRRQADQLREVTAKLSAIEGAHDEFTALAYAKLNDFPTNRPYLSRVGKAATRLMEKQGTSPHRRQDATFGWINVYPLAILDEAFADVAATAATP